MIQCAFSQDREGLYLGFRFTGHAELGPAGQDILCAAISTLGQTTIAAIADLVGTVPKFTIDEASGLIELELAEQDLTQRQREDASLLIASCLVGVKLAAEAYPQNLTWELR